MPGNAAGKVPICGLLEPGGKVHAVIIPVAKSLTLTNIMRERIKPDSIVYSDGFRSYDVSEFRHQRINHSVRFADRANPINGMENFWNQAKRHLCRDNSIPRHHFRLFLKECEWRFNHRPISNLLKTLLRWVNL